VTEIAKRPPEPLEMAQKAIPADEKLLSSRDILKALGISTHLLGPMRWANVLLHLKVPDSHPRAPKYTYPASYVQALRRMLDVHAKRYENISELAFLLLFQYAHDHAPDEEFQKCVRHLCRKLQPKYLVNTAKAAELLGIGGSSVAALAANNNLPHVRLGRGYIYGRRTLNVEWGIRKLPDAVAASEYLDIPIDLLRLKEAGGSLNPLMDAGGRRHYQPEELEQLRQRLEKAHDITAEEFGQRLGIDQSTVAVYRRRGLIEGTIVANGKKKNSRITYAPEEVDRVETEFKEYILYGTGFEWLEVYLKENPELEVNFVTPRVAGSMVSFTPGAIEKWHSLGIVPCHIQKFFSWSQTPPIFFADIYFKRLASYAKSQHQPMSRALACEFRDMCSQLGRLPLA